MDNRVNAARLHLLSVAAGVAAEAVLLLSQAAEMLAEALSKVADNAKAKHRESGR